MSTAKILLQKSKKLCRWAAFYISLNHITIHQYHLPNLMGCLQILSDFLQGTLTDSVIIRRIFISSEPFPIFPLFFHKFRSFRCVIYPPTAIHIRGYVLLSADKIKKSCNRATVTWLRIGIAPASSAPSHSSGSIISKTSIIA